MSNWEREVLNANQIKYAAMDAWASLLVYRALATRPMIDASNLTPYVCDPCPEPVDSSDDESSSSDEEDRGENEEYLDEEHDEEHIEDAVVDTGTLTRQSRQIMRPTSLSFEEQVVWERHMGGMTIDEICADTEDVHSSVMGNLVNAIRKGYAFYFDLLCIPEHLTLYFNDHVVLHGSVPKLADFSEFAQVDAKRCASTLIALTVKLARDREFESC
jgi:hypothetical protein